MGKSSSLLSGADQRPRVHLRLRGDTCEVTSNPAGIWFPVTDIIAGIDLVAGEGAYQRPAVLIWEGSNHA